MNMDPKGNKPLTRQMNRGRAQKAAGGIGLGNEATRHGLLGFPLRERPRIVPSV